jgi:hypothetical protein
MRRMLAVAIVFGATLGTSGLALAQAYYPAPGYGPAPGPYYQPYAPPPPVYAPQVYAPYQYDATHSGGGTSRAYWGGQKSN